MGEPRRYRYVGPDEIRAAIGQGAGGAAVQARADLAGWLAGRDRRELAEPFTYVVDPGGVLRLAARRSEHVACAGGGDVLAAGELAFARTDDGWVVSSVSNQSTGYCPDLDSWRAVTAALALAGVPHPEFFTDPVVFRRCPGCGERNIVREEHFVCALCDAALPAEWNF